MDPAQEFEAMMFSRQQTMYDAIARGDSHIQQFYANTTILITGATGFMGKQLIDKLLRSCKDLKKVFVLLRNKKGKSVSERLEQLIKDPVYEELSKRYPNFGEKIFAVEGDVSELKLGINDKDWKSITDQVNVIFHAAATINFDEPIKVATLTNVRGTREMLSLAKECKNLRSIVHISTAFSHATCKRFRSDVFEQFYPSPVPPDALIQCAENVEERRLNSITENLIEDWPNTYTFTKAVTEELVRQSGLPVCVVRPTVVIGAYLEPSPGWIDMNNVFGASGIMVGAGMAVTHTILIENESVLDVVPVDVANNAVIAAGWETAQRKADGEEEVKIYTITRYRNIISARDHIIEAKRIITSYFSPKAIWYGFHIDTSNKYVYLVLTWLLHYIPAMFVDTIARFFGQKPGLLKIYKKIYKLMSLLSYFLLNYWKFSDANLNDLYMKMSKSDQDIYNFDITTVNLRDMTIIWYLGIRKYIIKDGLKDTAYGLKRQFWFKIAHYILSFLFVYLLWMLFNFLLTFF